MKRSKIERLESEKNAREGRDIINGSREIYKNRFKGDNRRHLKGGNIHRIDDTLLDEVDEAFAG